MEPARPVKDTGSSLGALEGLPVEIIQDIMGKLDRRSLRQVILQSSRLYNIYMAAQEIIIYHIAGSEIGSWVVFGAAMARYASSKPSLNPGIDNFLVDPKSTNSIMAAKIELAGEVFMMDVSQFRISIADFTPSMVSEILEFNRHVNKVMADFEDEVDELLIEMHDMDEHEPRTYHTSLERVHMRMAIYMAEVVRLLLPGRLQAHNNEILRLYFNAKKFAGIYLQKRFIDESNFQVPLYSPYSMILEYAFIDRHGVR
ncbi:hypothetical protein GGS26DRAFT_592704 [Hypomontagnella submonticulosa]|nr:hypothetical protein GGS26DRAFT_592704 [Hypomontagnella submonticulosa]